MRGKIRVIDARWENKNYRKGECESYLTDRRWRVQSDDGIQSSMSMPYADKKSVFSLE